MSDPITSSHLVYFPVQQTHAFFKDTVGELGAAQTFPHPLLG